MWNSIATYISKTSGYRIGATSLIIMVILSVVGALILMFEGQYNYEKRTSGAYHYQTMHWSAGIGIYLLVNGVLLLLPGQPFGHWFMSLIYIAYIWKGMRLKAFKPESRELNDGMAARTVGYIGGFVPIAYPMVLLSDAKNTVISLSKANTNLFTYISVGVIVLIVLIIFGRGIHASLDWNRRFADNP